jgi:protein ImuB
MRPARRVEVETVGERPVRVETRLVVASAGPWRASGEWWDLQAWARDEWDVVLGDGALCRLARDRLAGHWYLDGFYD